MRSLNLLFLGLSVLLAGACSKEQDSVTHFDYDALEVIELSVETEISESEDYIPGSLASMAVLSDGTMLVYDRSHAALLQFSPEGEFIKVVAEEGNGPGEISRYFSMAPAGSDSLLIFPSGAGRVDIFVRTTDNRFEHSHGYLPEETTLNLERLGLRDVSTQYVLPDDLMSRFNNPADYRQAPVVIMDHMNRVVGDTIQTVRKANASITGQIDDNGQILSMNVMAPPPYRYEDQFVTLDNGHYMIARVDSSAFFFYNRDHDLQRVVPLGARPEVITEEDLDYHLGDLSPSYRRDMEEKLDQTKPLFMDVWAAGERILLQTDSGEEGKEMVLLNYDGEPLGRFLTPLFEEITHFTGERIYTILRDPGVGHTVRVYRLQL